MHGKFIAMGLLSTALFAMPAGASLYKPTNTDNGGTNAAVTNWTVDPVSGDYTLTLQGKQTADATLQQSYTADTAADPNVIVSDELVNDSGFTWQGYTVEVKMPQLFTLSNAAVTTPTDWTASIIPPSPIGGGIYDGLIIFNAGTPIAQNGEFDYQYKLSFSGSNSYTTTEIVNPSSTPVVVVPEPGAGAIAGVIGAGTLLLSRRRRSELA